MIGGECVDVRVSEIARKFITTVSRRLPCAQFMKIITVRLPDPFGPMIAVNGLRVPILILPLYDLKFSTSINLRYPISYIQITIQINKTFIDPCNSPNDKQLVYITIIDFMAGVSTFHTKSVVNIKQNTVANWL